MLTELVHSLKAMPLYGMAAALTELEAERPCPPPAPEVWLKRLVDAERVDRQARRLRYQLRVARFPIHRDFASFDWTESTVSRVHPERLATGQFMTEAHNLILVGGPGTGKTHLATALGSAAIHQGQRVRFYNAVDLVNRLEQEKRVGKAGASADADPCGHHR
jgi:DNA replication protein DnaC